MPTKNIRMRAKVAFTHDGERVRPGQIFNTSAIDAAALRYQGRADFATTIAPERADSADDAPRRGRYRRRDMRAEDAASPPETDE